MPNSRSSSNIGAAAAAGDEIAASSFTSHDKPRQVLTVKERVSNRR